MTVLSWRGTFSWPDFWVNGMWYGDRFRYDLPETTKARWIESNKEKKKQNKNKTFMNVFFFQTLDGNDEDELVHNPIADYMNRMLYDIGSPTIFASTVSGMTSDENLEGVENLEEQTYYAISKHMVHDILPAERNANNTIYFTG